MVHENIKGVPDFDEIIFHAKQSRYCLLIPVINEGERIKHELERAKRNSIHELCDIIICDGGSTDGSLRIDFLEKVGVNTLLIKKGSGKQGAQLRMGIYFALERSYEGVLTIDGNDKDSIECVPFFIEKVLEGADLVQGSRFIKGGQAINTPKIRYFALRVIHAPIISLAAGHHFTDTTNAFRAYSARYLKDPRTSPLRDVFDGYELLAYLSIRATQLGYSAVEVPVIRSYPETGAVPTKINGMRGNIELMSVLLKAALGAYNPRTTGEDLV